MTSILHIPESILSEQRGTTQSRLESLPAEMLAKVYRRLPLFDRISLARSSKHLAAIATNQQLLALNLVDPSPIKVGVIMNEMQPSVRIQNTEWISILRLLDPYLERTKCADYIRCNICEGRWVLNRPRRNWNGQQLRDLMQIQHIIGQLTYPGRYVTEGLAEVIATGLRIIRRRRESAIRNAAFITLRYKN